MGGHFGLPYFFIMFFSKKDPLMPGNLYFPPIQNPPLWGISLFQVRSIFRNHEHHSRLIWRKILFFLLYFKIRSRSHQCNTLFLWDLLSYCALFCDFFLAAIIVGWFWRQNCFFLLIFHLKSHAIGLFIIFSQKNT